MKCYALQNYVLYDTNPLISEYIATCYIKIDKTSLKYSTRIKQATVKHDMHIYVFMCFGSVSFSYESGSSDPFRGCIKTDPIGSLSETMSDTIPTSLILCSIYC